MNAHTLTDDEAGDIAVSQGGTASAAYGGVSVDSTGSVNIDGLVQNVLGYLDSKIPSWVSQTVGMAAEWAGDVVAVDAAVTSFSAAVGAGSVAAGAFGPVGAAVMAIPAFLLAVAPASGGAGCCGSQPLTSQQASALLSSLGRNPTFADILNFQRFGTCAPAEFGWWTGPGSAQCDGQWAGDHWTGGCPRAWSPSSAWEKFVGQWIISAYEQTNDCWHFMLPPSYGLALAQALGVWNRAHMGPAVTVREFVNMPGISTWQGKNTATVGNPVSYDPIPYALNLAAQRWAKDGHTSNGFLTGISGIASFTVNTGPAVSSVPRPPIRLGHPNIPLGPAPVTVTKPAGGSTGVALGAGAAAALVALRFAQPALFAKITAPVQRLASRLRRR